MRGVATPVLISGKSELFRDNLGAKADFWDTGKKSRTVPEILGLLATIVIFS